MMKDALHSKEFKIKKPYELKSKTNTIAVRGLFSTMAYAAGSIDDYPIINHKRYSDAFGGSIDNLWYVITDVYLHRVTDQDPEYDYMLLETISEFDQAYSNVLYEPADQFYTKLKPYYIDDIVRDGAPEDQPGSTTIWIDTAVPYLHFSYNPQAKIAIDSTLSLSDNYFKVYYKDGNRFLYGFDED
ncbi:MAG: hypothetical protein H0Z35_13790 [Thermoanaerobacteraceae bacterium]|nr:hypothetical protein [Thermoanaerobacteraceae bacterium]